MKFEPIPKYGSLMTLKHFIECVKTGCFIDYDGYGKYATKRRMSDKIISPSDITGKRSEFSFKTGKFKIIKVKKNVNRAFKYVVWFNK